MAMESLKQKCSEKTKGITLEIQERHKSSRYLVLRFGFAWPQLYAALDAGRHISGSSQLASQAVLSCCGAGLRIPSQVLKIKPARILNIGLSRCSVLLQRDVSPSAVPPAKTHAGRPPWSFVLCPLLGLLHEVLAISTADRRYDHY